MDTLKKLKAPGMGLSEVRGIAVFHNSAENKYTYFSGKNALKHLKSLHLDEQKRKHPTLPFYNPATFTDKTANGLTRCIIAFLRYSGHQAERISSEGRILDNRQTFTDYLGNLRTVGSVKRVYSTTTRGTADISATIAGRSVKVEVKIGKDKQSEAQKAYQQQIEAAGGIYFIADTFANFLNWYNETFVHHG